MPYIKQENRKWLDRVAKLATAQKPTVGDLNYLVTKLLLNTKPTSYAEYNALVGMLECCKLEFYRRAIVVYEDDKIRTNGDVYPSAGPKYNWPAGSDGE